MSRELNKFIYETFGDITDHHDREAGEIFYYQGQLGKVISSSPNSYSLAYLGMYPLYKRVLLWPVWYIKYKYKMYKLIHGKENNKTK